MNTCVICDRTQRADEKPFVVVGKNKRICLDCLKEIGWKGGYVFDCIYRKECAYDDVLELEKNTMHSNRNSD